MNCQTQNSFLATAEVTMNHSLSKTWRLDPQVENVVGSAICLTGTGRSGTTLLGSLIHSMQNVEYSFEPTFLTTLLVRASEIPPDLWRLLYGEYIYEELLLGALSGRNLNYNDADWSCVYRSKTRQEIEPRQSRPNRRSDLYDVSSSFTVAYKVPNITHSLNRIFDCFPRTRVVTIIRDPDEVVRSVMARGWFSEPTAAYRTSPLICHAEEGSVPAYLVGMSADKWLRLGEAERCYAIYAGCYGVSENLGLLVDYAALVENPKDQIKRLAEALGLCWGSLTDQLVNGICAPKSVDSVAPFAMGEWREKALAVYQKLRVRAL